MRRRQARAALLGCAALVGLLLCAQTSRACDCSGPDEPFEELVRAAQVFEAELLYELPKELNADDCPWQVKMLRAWKGTTTKKDEPVLNSCWCAQRGLQAGKTYIFYTSKTARTERSISMCSRVVPTEEAADDLAELGKPSEVRDPHQPLPVGLGTNEKLATSPPPPRRWRPSRLATCSLSQPNRAAAEGRTSRWLFLVAAALTTRRRRSQKG